MKKRFEVLYTNAAVAVAYVAAAQVGFLAAGLNDNVTAVWPPTGIAVAVVVFAGSRMWPGIAAGAVVANLLNGASPQLAAMIAVGNTLAPLAAGRLLARFDFRTALARLRDVVVLLVGGMSAMVVSATLGTAALAINGMPTSVDTWATWWIGDAMGVVLLAPFLLTSLDNDGLMRRRPLLSAALLVAMTTVTTAAVITDSPVGYTVIPLTMAVAIVLEQQGAAAAVLIMSVIDIGAALFTGPGAPDTDLMALQGVNATVCFIVLSLASVMHERRRAQHTLKESAAELESRVDERTEELQSAIDALRVSEERFEKAQRLAHIGSFQWDAATNANNWSDELFRIYGLDPRSDAPPGFDDYIGFIREDVREKTAETINDAIANGEPLSHEYPVVLRDGTRKWVHAYIEVVKALDGSLAGLRGTCQDITDRKGAQDALESSEGRFRALLESAPDAVIVVDHSGKIVLSNKQASSIFGYEREELLGQPLELLLPAEFHDQHTAHRHAYNSQPAIRPMGAGRDLYAQRKDGTRVAIDISLSPVETDTGYLVFALIRDASERRRIEDALRTALDREREAAEDLRKLDHAKNAFLSAVSHELRTPLTAILGFAELLQEPAIRTSEDMTTELVGRVQLSASRLNELLGDLLDLDRLHRGVVEPRRRLTGLRSLVLRAVQDLELGAHSLTLRVDDAAVEVDTAQTERIIENLLTNAVRYTPAGTEIRLRLHGTAAAGVDIVVEDEGPGVPRELWATIFEPFVRADTGTFTQGTGIGLSLVERFARLHGGTAEVTDREGGGALFHVALPGPARNADAAA